ncbi:MAG: hypothetical protein KY461_16070, partial [Actinobacteria bacterium]|nr:hypothetical protein [Actinomycetota bacterium]
LGTHTLHAAVSATGDVTGDPVGDTASAAYTATTPVVVRDQGPITTVTLPSDITVDVSADSDGYTVGDTITYTYVVTNGGEAALFDVSLSDDLLGDLTDRLGTRTLAPGAETTATATLVALDVHVGMLDTLAIAAATSADDEVSDTDTERVAVTDVLGVVIDKPAPQAPAPAPRPQPLPAPTAPTATPAAPVPAPAAVAELPRTGADPLPLGVLAASLVFAGSLLLRRTRTT